MVIPKKISDYIKDSTYEINDVGMSESQVYIYEKYVLKIQPATAETDNEYEILKWISGKCPTPIILEYIKENGTAFTLMTKAEGKMLCDEGVMKNPQNLVKLIAEGLKLLWSVDIKECPCSYSRLSERLKAARENVENGKVDLDNVEPETFGANGFANPAELLKWLEENKPEEDLVFSHGDFCLPNIFTDGVKIISFIDNGKMGPADRWQDLAIALRSLRHNYDGTYTDGVPYEGYHEKMLLDELGIAMDDKKNRYYLLLDELF